MKDLPCKGCKGLCCGPVPITQQEKINIKKAIRKMPNKKLLELKNQPRLLGTCIFFDESRDQCGIHSERPSICRAFGYYKNLVCFRVPASASSETYIAKEKPIGILSIDFTWDHFRK
ncbi:YkgJ family cysteine cluster protein [Alkalicoccobacillus porphyridii]|uniref:YkgJ family cysteine cluster protein n=1 Tax=Alkalicoccobacillus porphyridii TaxID=2597270 RepID=A0A554A1I9_9BACI|nr:YkgJ family cysteine cluster protein [Alkalicoccobacillus porphyridii]TSB47564.1 YkgJ family cysteine cluster protein [Alkalicoccobacillus porphyridii]